MAAGQEIEREDGLEAGTNVEFARRWWVFERTIHVVLTLVVLAGAAGLFGRGPLSKATAGSLDPSSGGGGLQVDYERFARFRTPTVLLVHLGAGALRGGEVAVRLTGTINDRLPVSRVVPQPKSVSPIVDGQLYTFAIAEPGDSATIRFTLEGAKPGRSAAAIGVGGAPAVSLSQYVFP